MNSLYKFCATGAFISYLPTAILRNKKNTGAGFLGTVEGLLIYLFLMPRGYAAYGIVLALLLVFSVIVSDRVDFGDGQKDNPKIVIDEIVGFLVAVAFLPFDGFIMLSAFVMFRLFDTVKTGPVRWAERFGQDWAQDKQKKYFIAGTAVVLDDVIAGLIANLTLQTAVWLQLL